MLCYDWRGNASRLEGRERARWGKGAGLGWELDTREFGQVWVEHYGSRFGNQHFWGLSGIEHGASVTTCGVVMGAGWWIQRQLLASSCLVSCAWSFLGARPVYAECDVNWSRGLTFPCMARCSCLVSSRSPSPSSPERLHLPIHFPGLHHRPSQPRACGFLANLAHSLLSGTFQSFSGHQQRVLKARCTRRHQKRCVPDLTPTILQAP